ncbi:dihydrolipoyl dehydrogenase [Thiomicrorhabdus cannonii]|uniref:dihydrolipoyl dehydrogenase n=1 Tax=Thiomicrorhabdus cannonii TaxID=2748011 RepID=UPI0015B7CEEE|nr:dihydrolipoyl dehydrogenase [Thiomicrorhabdus cannonii]
MRKVKYAILGAGSAGLTASSLIRKHSDDFVLIDGGPLGTTCACVGCMPSKALIQSANVYARREDFAEFGLQGDVDVDSAKVMERVRRLRDRFSGGVRAATTDKLPESQLMRGYARFIGPNRLQVDGEEIEAERIIIATGSTPIVPAPWKALGNKLWTSDEIFEQATLPKRIAVIGLGVIGLELGQALARLGVEVHGFEMAHHIGGLAVPEVSAKAVELISQDFPLYLGEAAQLEETAQGVRVYTSKTDVEVDVVLAALGRRANLDGLDLQKAGVALNEAGLPDFDLHTLQIGDKPLFIAGDVNGFRPILHEAGFEGKMAALNALDYPEVKAYARKTSLAIAFSEPDIGVFGESYRHLDLTQTAVAQFDLERNNGRAIVMHQDHGMICLFADKSSKRLLGGEMVMPHAEHFVHLLAWAVEQRLTVADLMRMPFYHPVLEEAIQSAITELYKQLYAVEERPRAPELTVLQ